MSEIEKLKSQLTRIKAERDLYRGSLYEIYRLDVSLPETYGNRSIAEINTAKLEKISELAWQTLTKGTKIANNEVESRG